MSDTEDKWEFTRDLKHRIAALYGYPQEVVRRLASEVSLILMAVYKKNYTQFWRYRVYLLSVSYYTTTVHGIRYNMKNSATLNKMRGNFSRIRDFAGFGLSN